MIEPRSIRQRRVIADLGKLLVPIVVVLFVTYLRFVVVESAPFLEAAVIFTVVAAVIVVTWLSWPSVDRIFWRLKGRRRFRNPRVGVLLEQGCNPTLSKFGPQDWLVSLSKRWGQVCYVAPEGIVTKYAIIVNPYGETYPEEYVLRTRTLNRIERFVLDGGVFLSAGGFPFFYAFDRKNGTQVPLASELALLQGRLDASAISMIPGTTLGIVTGTRAILEPAFAPGLYDLVSGTILLTRLHLRVALGSEEIVSLYQNPSDVSLVGDLIAATGLNSMIQFRAVRQPIPNCYPLVRAKSKAYGEIYPLVAVPYGKGFFLFADVMLEHPDQKYSAIVEKTFAFVQQALFGFCEGITRGAVPLEVEI